MAEDIQQEVPKKSRRLRGSSETIREQSEKRQLQASVPEKPSRVRAFLSGFTWPLRALGRQIKKLERFHIFRIIGRILLPLYLRNSWRELRQVTWPNRSTTLRLTFAVIVFSLVFGLIVAAVDFVLDKIFKELILK